MNTCQADRIATFEHASAVAENRAAAVHPVHVDEAPPLPPVQPEANSSAPLYLARPHRVWDAPKSCKGPQRKTTMRASIVNRVNAALEPVFVAHVRVPGEGIRYLGRFALLADAEEACRVFIETGGKPPVARRGTKIGQQQQPGTARNRATIGRKVPPAQNAASWLAEAATGHNRLKRGSP